MKIKVRPDDFSVNEISNLALKQKGAFACYRLYKQGWNTVEIINHLSKALSIPFNAFSYGGRKDRYGSTWQYITIEDARIFDSVSESYQLKFSGFMDRPMGPDLIEANEFKITIRDVEAKDLPATKKTIQQIATFGYPNYFDDQRFGSYRPLYGFLAERILKGHFNGALKTLLTFPSTSDSGPEKKRKLFLGDHWGQWQLCLNNAKTGFEKQTFSHLLKEPKGFLSLLRKIPQHDLSFYFSVYQSYLWNELLRRIIKKTCQTAILSFKGVAGDYLFYSTINDDNLHYLKGLSLALPCAKVKMPDTLSQGFYKETLAGAGIRQGMFNNIKTRQSFFCRAPRNALVFPENISYEFAADEIFQKKTKLILSFRLPRGSFATMLIKRLSL